MIRSRLLAFSLGVVLLSGLALLPTPSRASTDSSTTATAAPTASASPTATATPLSLDDLAQALRLPDATFAPAQVDPQFDRTEDNATADGDAFSADHSASFEQLGRYSGYFQQAEYQPANSTDSAIYQYQASIYGSDAMARSAFQDGVHTVQEYSGGSVDWCADNSCATVWASKIEGENRIVYFAAYAAYCVAEVQASIPAAIFASAAGGATLVASIQDAAQHLIGQTCTEPPPAAPVPTPTSNPYPASLPIPVLTAIPAVTPIPPCPTSGLAGIQVSACMTDTAPTDLELDTVLASITDDGAPLAGVPMLAVWSFKSGPSYCTGISDADGQTSCSLGIGRAAIGYTVNVTVTFTYNGQPYSWVASFTPQVP